MTQITIPASLGDAIAALGGLDRLLTAKQWERAAIVATFVEEPGQGSRTDLATSSQVRSPHQFAALGIAGLSSKDTVRRYVEAWKSTGRPRPMPGDVVDLNGLPPWPPAESTVQAIQRNTRATAVALADDTTRRKVLDSMDKRHITALVIEALQDTAVRDSAVSAVLAYSDAEDENTPRTRGESKPRDYGRIIESAVNNISVALAAASAGKWELTSRDEALLYFVTKLLGERLAPEGELAEMVQSKLNSNLDEIERYANAGGMR